MSARTHRIRTFRKSRVVIVRALTPDDGALLGFVSNDRLPNFAASAARVALDEESAGMDEETLRSLDLVPGDRARAWVPE